MVDAGSTAVCVRRPRAWNRLPLPHEHLSHANIVIGREVMLERRLPDAKPQELRPAVVECF